CATHATRPSARVAPAPPNRRRGVRSAVSRRDADSPITSGAHLSHTRLASPPRTRAGLALIPGLPHHTPFKRARSAVRMHRGGGTGGGLGAAREQAGGGGRRGPGGRGEQRSNWADGGGTTMPTGGIACPVSPNGSIPALLPATARRREGHSSSYHAGPACWC